MLGYHRTIQKGIDEFGTLHLRNEVSSFSKGGEWLQIIHRTKQLQPIKFKPDRVFTLRNRSKVVFQVLGSQAGKPREIEADIFRAFLCLGISKLVFIVPTSTDYDNVNRVSDIIRDVLEALGARDDLDLSMTILIPKKVKSPSAVKDYLNESTTAREIFRE